MFDPIAPQVFEAKTTGGRFDSMRVHAPLPTAVESAAKKLQLPIKVSTRHDGAISITANDLHWDTELETHLGILTVSDAMATEEFTTTGKLRCQTPFRASDSEAAFLGRGKDGRPFVYDAGTSTTHWLNDEDWRTKPPESEAVCEKVEPLFSIDACRAARYLATEPPPMKWLLVNTLPAGVVGILVAPGGTGKSWYLIQLGVSIATGMPLARTWEVGEVGSVLMFLAEDDTTQIQRRLHHLVNALSADQYLSIREKLHGNLIIASRVAENNLLTSGSSYSREVELTELVDRIIVTASQIPDLKLIVIDPVSRFRGGDENAAQDTSRFVEALEKISKATGAAVIAAHHANKSTLNSSEPSQSASRGSSALTDGVRWQMNLATFTPTDAKNFGVPVEEKGFHLTATVTKNNYSAPQPSVHLKRREGGYLDKSDLMPVAQAKVETLQTAIVDLVRTELQANRKYSKTAFTNQFAGEDGPLKTGNNKVRDVVQELLDCRRLILDNAKKLALSVRAKIKQS